MSRPLVHNGPFGTSTLDTASCGRGWVVEFKPNSKGRQRGLKSGWAVFQDRHDALACLRISFLAYPARRSKPSYSKQQSQAFNFRDA